MLIGCKGCINPQRQAARAHFASHTCERAADLAEGAQGTIYFWLGRCDNPVSVGCRETPKLITFGPLRARGCCLCLWAVICIRNNEGSPAAAATAAGVASGRRVNFVGRARVSSLSLYLASGSRAGAGEFSSPGDGSCSFYDGRL